MLNILTQPADFMMLNFLLYFVFAFSVLLNAMEVSAPSPQNTCIDIFSISDDTWNLILNYAAQANIMDLQKEFFAGIRTRVLTVAPNQNSYTESYINQPFVYVDAEYKKKFFKHQLFFPNCFKSVCLKFKLINSRYFKNDIFFNVSQLTFKTVSTCIEFDYMQKLHKNIKNEKELHNILYQALPHEHKKHMIFSTSFDDHESFQNLLLRLPIPLALVHFLYQSLINSESFPYSFLRCNSNSTTSHLLVDTIVYEPELLQVLRQLGIKHISFFELILGILYDPYMPKNDKDHKITLLKKLYTSYKKGINTLYRNDPLNQKMNADNKKTFDSFFTEDIDFIDRTIKILQNSYDPLYDSVRSLLLKQGQDTSKFALFSTQKTLLFYWLKNYGNRIIVTTTGFLVHEIIKRLQVDTNGLSEDLKEKLAILMSPDSSSIESLITKEIFEEFEYQDLLTIFTYISGYLEQIITFIKSGDNNRKFCFQNISLLVKKVKEYGEKYLSQEDGFTKFIDSIKKSSGQNLPAPTLSDAYINALEASKSTIHNLEKNLKTKEESIMTLNNRITSLITEQKTTTDKLDRKVQTIKKLKGLISDFNIKIDEEQKNNTTTSEIIQNQENTIIEKT